MRKVVSATRSGPGGWLRIVRAYLWLFRAKRLMGRARGYQWLFGEHESEISSAADQELTEQNRALIKQRVAAISRASRYPVSWAFCLQRSLALREWLAKDGLFTEVRYGIRKRDGAFDAHAWVVFDGKIINDSATHVSTFAPLKSMSEFGEDTRAQIGNAVVTSRTKSENAGEAV